MLIVLAAAGGGAYLVWQAPRVELVNHLPVDARVRWPDGNTEVLAARTKRVVTVRRRQPFLVEWQLLPVAESTPELALPNGSRSLTLPHNPLEVASIPITRGAGDAEWFFPLVTNDGTQPIHLVANAGLSRGDVRLEGDCGCTVPAGAERMPIGGFPLVRNSTVTAVRADGRRAVFRDLADAVDLVSGVVRLTFRDADFR